MSFRRPRRLFCVNLSTVRLNFPNSKRTFSECRFSGREALSKYYRGLKMNKRMKMRGQIVRGGRRAGWILLMLGGKSLLIWGRMRLWGRRWSCLRHLFRRGMCGRRIDWEPLQLVAYLKNWRTLMVLPPSISSHRNSPTNLLTEPRSTKCQI